MKVYITSIRDNGYGKLQADINIDMELENSQGYKVPQKGAECLSIGYAELTQKPEDKKGFNLSIKDIDKDPD